MKDNKVLFVTTRLCVVILVGFMLTSMLTYVVQNVLCEGMRMDNQFVRFVIGDDKVEEIMTNWNQPYEIAINWAELYPFAEGVEQEIVQQEVVQQKEPKQGVGIPVVDKALDLYLKIWSYLQEGTDQYTGNLHMFFGEMVNAGEAYNRFVSWDYLATQTGNLRTFTMKDGTLGYLTDETSSENLADIIASVSDFDVYLKGQEIPFLYVNPGTKICEENYEVPAYLSDYIVQNQNRFLAGLEENGVDYIDLREVMHEEGRDHKGSFYVTDPHWRFETALWAAGEIAEYSNENYGFEFDVASFSEENYMITEYDDAFMGSQGLALHLPENKKKILRPCIPKRSRLTILRFYPET